MAVCKKKKCVATAIETFEFYSLCKMTNCRLQTNCNITPCNLIANRKTKSCKLANGKLQTAKQNVANCMIVTTTNLVTSSD
mmetsp:Transcript_68443/g.113778  ORF Transcript_68443/g.113778 Transcript_68443/m.113778 type:complete len:81 (-) Transcript_68443:1001-1243(-)